jgi:single-strand DNA-binding protein
MANLNKVMLMGNLTREPQLSYLPSQTAVVALGLAVNRTWKSADGEKKQEVCFIDCVAFGKSAETLNKYLSKGQLIFVEGRLSFESWKDKDSGKRRTKHRVIVEKFQFLPSGNNQQQSQGGGANPEYDENYVPPNDDLPF